MSGTKAGAKIAVETIKRKHGEDFFKIIGREGGKIGRTGGFYADRELARRAGAIGGRISKRGPNKVKPDFDINVPIEVPTSKWNIFKRRSV